MSRGPLVILSAYWLPLTATFLLAWLLYNKFHAGLNRIPGPSLAGLTKLWRLYQVRKGTFHRDLIALHKQYGPLVRIAPDVVSVGDPSMIPVVYGLKHNFRKTAFYPIQSISWRKEISYNIFSTRDPAEHREQKKKISAAYSMSNLLQSESKVDDCTKAFMAKLKNFADAGKDFDMGSWLQYYAFDVVGELTFGQPLGFLEQGRDVDDMMKAIEGMLSYATLCGQVPEAHHVLLGNPLLTKFMPAMETWNQVVLFTLKALNSRTRMKRDEELQEVEGHGVDMLSRWNAVKTSDPEKMNTKEIVTHLSTNVFAGSDTTAIALRSVIYNLCRHPDKMQKVLAEIDSADQVGKLSDPISYKESTTHLPYFAAVLKEAMRLHPSVGLISERHTPPEGAEICSTFIPGNTIVGISSWVLNYDAATFHDPETFLPERWLGDTEKNPDLRKREDILMFNFGAGARSCLGKNISMMEMQKVVPELLRRFEVSMETGHDWKVRGFWFVQQEDLICRVKARKL